MCVARKPSSVLLSVAVASTLLVGVSCADRQSLTGVAAPTARTADVIGPDIAFGALDYSLTSFEMSTLTLKATTNLNPGDPYQPGDPYIPTDPYRTFTAAFTTGSRFVPARLDTYSPTDPYCPALAGNYNASLSVSTSDGGSLYALISGMAANHCNARILVDLRSATIRSFQPVP